MLILKMARLYSMIYWYIHSRFNYNIRGLGFFLRLLKKEFIFNVKGISIYFNKEIPGAYARIITGNFNEPETHIFLKNIINNIDSDLTFVDVGSNIGEFILDVARYKNVQKVIGFEPDPRAAKASRVSVLINNFDKVSIIEKVVNSDGSPTQFIFGSQSLGSRITTKKDSNSALLEATTLDSEFPDPIGPSIVLIDVEGAEPLVLEGGKKFIERDKPLIIFEYNQLSQQFFPLDEIKSILGRDYYVYRLRNDGFLDSDLTRTWNCVAINCRSEFYSLLEMMSK